MRPEDTTASTDKLFKEAALYILGESGIPRLTGETEQVHATLEAMNASRALYEALSAESTSLSAAGVLLERKRAAATRFEKLTGIRWRL
jgi:hypothetical protein